MENSEALKEAFQCKKPVSKGLAGCRFLIEFVGINFVMYNTSSVANYVQLSMTFNDLSK